MRDLAGNVSRETVFTNGRRQLTRRYRAPKPGDGRARRSEHCRLQITNGVLKLVADGIYQPSVKQLTHAAGLSWTTIRHHFRTPEILMRHVSRTAAPDVLAALQLPGLVATDLTDTQARVIAWAILVGKRMEQS